MYFWKIMDSSWNRLKSLAEGSTLETKEDHLSEREYSVKERKSHKWNHCFIMSGHDYKEV